MTSLQGLAGRILPARGAAQKATASFAEQLTDSPGHSDGESPSSASLFHEPAQRTRAVKYRYSATGKHLSSPLKGSSSSPEGKPAKSKLKRMAIPSPHVAKAKPPSLATESRKRKTSSPSVCNANPQQANTLLSESPLSSAPATPVLTTNDLPPSPSVTVKALIPDPPKCTPVSKTLSLRSLKPTPSTLSVFSQPLSRKRKQTKTKRSTKKDFASWDIGNSVWVLVNQSGMLADSTNLELSVQLMWWPAQVVQTQPLRVSLFGEFPSSSSTSRGLCTIFAPSSSNVLSMHDDSGSKRFSRTTFCLTSSPSDDSVVPPAKKPRLDESASIEAKWESAVKCMEKASTLEKEGLPALLSSYATTGSTFYDSLDDSDPDMSNPRQSSRKAVTPAPKKSKLTESTRKLKTQSSRANLKDSMNESTPRDYSLCPPDPTLQIPGELVLAMAPRTRGSFWPARILEHVPDRKEKYRVKFLDEEEHVITRERFYTSEEEGFVMCALGTWESAVKTTDDPESGDEGEFGIDDDDDANTTLDDADLPPPPHADDFESLSVRSQFAYVKPVLRAILNRGYEPAMAKHEAFMKGGAARVDLLKSAGVRGGMDARFVKAVQKTICRWVFGDGGLKPERLDPGNDLTMSGVEEGATADVISSDVPETLPRESTGDHKVKDDKIEGIEGTVIPKGVQPLGNDDGPGKETEVPQDIEMADDRPEQRPTPLPPVNSLTLSPAVQQASLSAKSQLDLLAEVSQAVATEPSLLPSYPEVPRLQVHLPHQDTSSQPSPLTPVPDDIEQTPPQSSGVNACDEIETLSGVEKLDYCLNILLPEAIQQLLLWRTGERTSSALLSAEEEQRLHGVGVQKARQTDWVDDLMRLRAAQARLWGVDLDKKAEAKVIQGGTRTRPRQSTISRP